LKVLRDSPGIFMYTGSQ